MKNVLIWGVPRSGKSTLAKKLNKDLNYNIIFLDDIVDAFRIGLPDIGIKFWNELLDEDLMANCEAKLNQFIAAFLERLLLKKKEGGHLNYCFEGSWFKFNQLAKIIDLSNFVIVCLGYPKLTEQDVAERMKKYDHPEDWSYSLSDEQRLKVVSQYVFMNAEVLETSKKYDLKFFDTSDDFTKTIDEAYNYIIKNIN